MSCGCGPLLVCAARSCFFPRHRCFCCDGRHECVESAFVGFVRLFLLSFVQLFLFFLQLFVRFFFLGFAQLALLRDTDIIHGRFGECIEHGIANCEIPCVCVVWVKVGSPLDLRCQADADKVHVHKVRESWQADPDLFRLQVICEGVLHVDCKRGVECRLKVPGEFEQSLHALFDDRAAPTRYGLGEGADHLLEVFFLGAARHEFAHLDEQGIEEFIRGLPQPAEHIVHVHISKDTHRQHAT